MAENSMLLTVDTGSLMAIGAATKVLKGLDKVLSSVAQGVREAFSVAGYRDYLKAVKRFGKDLADELLTLRLAFGRMQVAIAQAVAPIAAVFVPWLNEAVAAVTRFASLLGQFFSGLIIGITGSDALAQSAENAAQAEENLAGAASSAGRAVRRSLMGFDELERLNSGSGGGGSSAGGLVDTSFLPQAITPQVQALVDQVLALLAPLLAIDLGPLQTALQTLSAAFSGLAGQVGTVLSFLWYEILTPFIAWIAETCGPGLVNGLAAALDTVSAAISPVQTGMALLWEGLKPVVEYIGQFVVTAIQAWQGAFESLTGVFREKSPALLAVFQNLAQTVTAVWGLIQPVMAAMSQFTAQTFGQMGQTVSQVTGRIIDGLAGLSQYIAGVFTGNWGSAWEGIRTLLRSVINGVISLLNGMISRLVSAVNAAVYAANRLSFTVPGWVPGIGGSRFGFNIRAISAPSIPYLAQGAVLPANKPFLAVVGDQTHGTNVEAPLSTIRQAVGEALEGQMTQLGAGIAAMVAEQRRTRQAVAAIRVGDAVIGQAADRYFSNMAAISGGFAG